MTKSIINKDTLEFLKKEYPKDLKAIMGLDPERELFKIITSEIEAMLADHNFEYSTKDLLSLVFEFYDTDINPGIKNWQDECKKAWAERDTK